MLPYPILQQMPPRHRAVVIRNSWGKGFGMNGYAFISMDSDCGISNSGFVPIVQYSTA